MYSMVSRLGIRSRYALCTFAGITTSQPGRFFSSSTAENNSNIKLSLTGTPEYSNVSYNDEENKFLFMTSIGAPLIDTQNRSSIDLVCVLDESGSMTGPPIELLKESMKFIVSNLTSNDRFGCIGYETVARQICPFKYMASTNKQDALNQITSMQSLGTTALCEGLEMGVNMMRDCKTNDDKNDMDYKNRVKNVLLLTDGCANVGYTDPKDIIRALTDKEFADKGRETEGKTTSRAARRLKSFAASATKFTELTADNTQNDYSVLPCNIDAFGFGDHHDDMMLKMISEYGRGIYAYISGTEDIVGTFGEMLGGMLSVVGKDIKIRVKSLNDNVKIGKCLAVNDDNKTMKLKEIEKEKCYEISILNDIQSEENRDLIFEISVPKINVVDDNWNYIQIECEYFNVFTNQLEQISTVCQIERSAKSSDKIRNYNIDVQLNRMTATNAIKEALEKANNGDLDAAKNIIKDAQNIISNSVSKDDDYCQSLLKDLEHCVDGMASRAAFDNFGSKYSNTLWSMNTTQRSYQSESVYHDDDADYSVPASSKKFTSMGKSAWRSKSQTK